MNADDPRHGTKGAYDHEYCRCKACRRANAAYQSAYIMAHPEQKEKRRLRARKRRALFLVLGFGVALLLAAAKHTPQAIQPGHDHQEAATCAGGLTASANQYSGGSLTMKLGTVTYSTTFTAGYSHTIANPNPTASQAWRVTVTSTDGVGSFDVQGTVPACQTSTTVSIPSTSTPSSTATTTSVPTTSATTAPPSTGPPTSPAASTTPATSPASTSSPARTAPKPVALTLPGTR